MPVDRFILNNPQELNNRGSDIRNNARCNMNSRGRIQTVIISVLVALAVAGILIHMSGSNSLSSPTLAASRSIEVGKIYSIGTLIGNNGLFPLTIRNITLEDSASMEVLNVLETSGPHLFGFEEGYPNWSGVQNATGARLLSGEEASLGYIVRALKPGKYTLNRLVIDYTYMGLPYRKVIERNALTLCARSIGELISPCR